MSGFLTPPDGESVLWSGHPSWWSFAVWLYLAGLLLFAFGLGIPFLIILILIRNSHSYTVTDKRIIMRRGLFRRQCVSLRAEEVESVTTETEDLPVAPGTGTIIIQGAGKTIRFESVRPCQELKKLIGRVIRPED